ncbi:MAG: amidohydrolase family protein [Betaproteobacteria bacterium]
MHRGFPGSAGLFGGLTFVACPLCVMPQAHAQMRRRETFVAGKRAKVIDVHAHCAVPEAMALMGLKLGGPSLRPDLHMGSALAERLDAMDAQGIDMQVLSINPYWYKADRELAEQIIRLQNEKLAEACAATPERFLGFASVALQHPDIAARQLEEGMKQYGLRGAAIGGSVDGAELSDARFHPFWAKAEALGALVFIHPQVAGATTDIARRLKGAGGLDNVIGFPLETTIALSHLIFEGTLDRFPGLRICAAHGGGYLPSYAARSDRGCVARPDLCAGGAGGPLKKKPTDYLRQLYFDTMVFSPEAVRHLAAEVGASQLMLGTDYPFPWTTTAVDEVMATPGLSDAERVAILGETAARLLGIAG